MFYYARDESYSRTCCKQVKIMNIEIIAGVLVMFESIVILCYLELHSIIKYVSCIICYI